jgi:crotonobetainyl-CoA:carnitine CoA-transferase CaiB-like acyl-CoA transferase
MYSKDTDLSLPLTGIRILEPGFNLAVPLATRLLADMGAEVIKIESPSRTEPGRTIYFPDDKLGERFWDQGGFYHETNRNKLGLSIDLTTEDGRTIFRELVKTVDVVVENFTPRVMRNFGLSYEDLRRIKPDIIMLSNSGYGHTGEWSNYKAFGMTSEPTTGQSHFTGYLNGPPMRTTFAYTDSPVAMLNAFAVLAALEHRSQTGIGQWIDVAMYEAGVFMLAEAMMDYGMNGRVGARMGNREPLLAPQGAYRCAGRDSWVVLTIESNNQWNSLCDVMGKSELAKEARFSDMQGRVKHHNELDTIIESWTRDKDHYDVMRLLQEAGIPAGPVLTNKGLLTDPHLVERGFLEWVHHPPEQESMGERVYPGMSWKVSNASPKIRWPAPSLGQHNYKLLSELLGLSSARIEELEAMGVIGDKPRYEVKPRTLGTEELRAAGSIWPPDADYSDILKRAHRREPEDSRSKE